MERAALPSIGDDPDNIPGACDEVAACKETLDIGLKGFRIDGQAGPFRDFEADLVGKERDIRRLTDRGDEKINVEVKLRSFDRHGPSSPIRFRLTQPITNASNTRNPNPIFGKDPNRGGEVMDLDAFFFNLLQFLWIYRHLFPRPPVKDEDLFCSKAEGGPCRVHGGIASAYHSHFLPDLQILTQIQHLHKGDAVDHPLQVFSDDPQFFGLVGTRGDIDRIILLSQAL